MDGVRKLMKEAITAGFFNIDIDSSTLVDLDRPNVVEQQRDNFEVGADLTAYVRSLEPKGVTISVGGEIGEVGGKIRRLRNSKFISTTIWRPCRR